MKRLYNFTLSKETEIETQTESKNDAGETVIVKKKEKVMTPYQFFVLNPPRNLKDQASLYNSVEVNRALKAGMLSVFQIDRKYREDGVFTEEDNQKYKDLCGSLIKLIDELQLINKTPEAERTEEQKKRWDAISEEMNGIQGQLKNYDEIKNNLYIHSAEYRARNLTVTWWVLHLSYKEEGGKELPFFPGSTLEEKLKSYDNLTEQNDPFITEVMEKFLYVVSFWMINGASKPEDFADLEKVMLEEKNKKV